MEKEMDKRGSELGVGPVLAVLGQSHAWLGTRREFSNKESIGGSPTRR